MILIRLKGGIGNQIFQFSEYVFLNKKGFKVFLDTSFYIYNNIHGGPELHRYFSSVTYSSRLLTVLIIILNRFYKWVFRKPLVKIKASAAQQGYLSQKAIREMQKRYIGHCNNPNISEEVQDDVCVMHIRGGDYLIDKNMTIYYQLDGDYYLKAFNKMEERSCIKLVEVVTDDKVHAANIIQFLHKATGVDFKLSNSDNSQLDFEKIRMARKKILSNSTFSLWAALIGGDDEIIAPSTWFIDHKVNAEYYDRTLSSLSYKIKFL